MNIAFLLGVGVGLLLGMSVSLLVIVLHIRQERRAREGVQSFPIPRARVRG